MIRISLWFDIVQYCNSSKLLVSSWRSWTKERKEGRNEIVPIKIQGIESLDKKKGRGIVSTHNSAMFIPHIGDYRKAKGRALNQRVVSHSWGQSRIFGVFQLSSKHDTGNRSKTKIFTDPAKKQCPRKCYAATDVEGNAEQTTRVLKENNDV